MARLRAFLVLFLASALIGPAMAASTAKSSSSRSTVRDSVIADHIPQFDGPTTMVTGPDGRTWATWSYRAAGEFDIAVASADANATTWSAPEFFGRRNGSDEIDPTLAVDSRGAVYLAFAMTNPSRVAISILSPGSSSWSQPVVVSGAEIASSPALMLVGDRLVVAFRTLRGVRIVLPTLDSEYHVNGIQDGPDATNPLGVKERIPTEGSTPAPTYIPHP